MRVGIIDYGVGNLSSVVRALELIRVTPVTIINTSEMSLVDKLILPGVGNFKDCAQLLKNGGWMNALREEALTNAKPLLGICLGMQFLATTSMEGVDENSSFGVAGLNLIPGRVESLKKLGCKLRLPHIGWNSVTSCSAVGGLFNLVPDETDFYFVHSYAFVPEDPAHVLATTDYGIPVTAAVKCGNIWGTQFHPEKSSRAGLQILRNFIENPIC